MTTNAELIKWINQFPSSFHMEAWIEDTPYKSERMLGIAKSLLYHGREYGLGLPQVIQLLVYLEAKRFSRMVTADYKREDLLND